MPYLQEVAKRREAIKRHYERGGYGENAPRPLCECCSDEGYIAQHKPVWTAVEHGGFLEAAVGWVECSECPLALEMMNAAAVEAAAS